MALDNFSITSDYSVATTPSKANTQVKNTKDFCKNIQDYYIYNEDGVVIGIDYQKMYGQQNKEEVKGLTPLQEDTFVSQTAHVAGETVKSDVKKAKNSYENITDNYNQVHVSVDLTSEMEKESAQLRSRIYEMEIKKIDLTKTSGTLTTILEASRAFQQKVKELEEDIITFASEAKNDEEAEWDNNPFWNNAITVYQADEKAAV